MKKLITVLFLLPLFCFAQKDKWIYICQFMAGSADGVNQSISHHELGLGYRFWDYSNSWKNKYKDFDNGDTRAAFFGSKSVFVGFTDGYHLTRLIDRAFTTGSLAFALSEKNNWRQIVKKVIISAVVNRAGFLITYNIICK